MNSVETKSNETKSNETNLVEPNLVEYYYRLDELLEFRSVLDYGLDGLEELELDVNTPDPYLQAIYNMYGVFEESNLHKAFNLLSDIYSHKIQFEPWKSMKTSVYAFVLYKLSLFYLGYGRIVELDMNKFKDYINEAISLGHRVAMIDKADELLEMTSDKKMTSDITDLYINALKLGNKNALHGVLSCYEIMDDFKMITYHYENIMSSDKPSYYIEYAGYFDRMILKSNDNEKKLELINMFINTLIVKSDDVVKTILFKHRYIFSENILDDLNKLILLSTNDIRDNIMDNILIVLNGNNLLYKGYILKLLNCPR